MLNLKIKYFGIIFLFMTLFFLANTLMSSSQIKSEFSNVLDGFFDKIIRFSNFYINAEYKEKEKGTYNFIDGSFLVVNHNSNVLDLKHGINKLKESFKVNEGIYIISILNKSNGKIDYSYFMPLVKSYENKVYSYNEMLNKYNSIDIFDKYGSCDLVITGVYEDSFNNRLIRTVIYPIYIDRKLVSILTIDIDVDYVINNIKRNLGFFSYFISIESNGVIDPSSNKINVSCSESEYLTINIKISKIIMISLLLSSLVYLTYNFIMFFIARYYSIDALTGLYRRDYIDRICLSGEQSLLYIDVDDFKFINDTYGHHIGDAVIVDIANIIKSNIRGKDKAFRWGGDEYLIVLDVIDFKLVIDVAERISKSVQNEITNGLKVTISIGGYVGDAKFVEALLKSDSMLYRSKKDGKNKINIDF